MQTKKYLIVLILRVLETVSDKYNPLTQVQIANMISQAFPCDRKTVGRNIGFLKKIGYPIVKTNRGFYMDKQLFTRAEIGYILNSVNSNQTTFEGKEELLQKLRRSLTKYYTR